MFELTKTALVAILKKVLMAALTEEALKVIVIGGLEKLAKSTKTQIDDEYVEKIKKAL